MHLKEQDDLIQYIHHLIEREKLSPHQAFARVQASLLKHHKGQVCPDLRSHCPNIGRVFLQLDLIRALDDYDHGARITKRRFVLPSFSDIRKILNLATVRSMAFSSPPIGLVTLDADDTIYADGAVLDMSSPMISVITRLMICGLHVGIVTAASYPGEPHKFEARLAGLLASLAYALDCGAPESLLERFHVMGGQCNYMYRAGVSWDEGGDKGPRVHLIEVPPEDWKAYRGMRWDHTEIQKLLDVCENSLRSTAAILELDVLLIRKERAVGIVSRNVTSNPLSYEVLEEAALAVQAAITEAGLDFIPHCAFNGGKDVFVDIGHKALGIKALQGLLGIAPAQTVHCGDRFTRTGNDRAAREVANTLWVASPAETEYLLTLLQQHLREAGHIRPRRSTAGLQEATGLDSTALPTLSTRGSVSPPLITSPGVAGRAALPSVGSVTSEPGGLADAAQSATSGVVGTPKAGALRSPTEMIKGMGISAHAALDVAPATAAGDIAGSVIRPADASTASIGLAVRLPPGSPPVSPASSARAVATPNRGAAAGLAGPGVGTPKFGAPQLHPLHVGLFQSVDSAGSGAAAMEQGEAGEHGEELTLAGRHPLTVHVHAHGVGIGGATLPVPGAAGGSGHGGVSPTVYGGPMPMHGKEAEQRLADQLRSQWAASGGTVVADMRPPLSSRAAARSGQFGHGGHGHGHGQAGSRSPAPRHQQSEESARSSASSSEAQK